jgi:hypothetical protein
LEVEVERGVEEIVDGCNPKRHSIPVSQIRLREGWSKQRSSMEEIASFNEGLYFEMSQLLRC